MYLRQAYRGRAIGRRLLEPPIDEATEKGSKLVRLDSARLMNRAHELYRSLGFREIGPCPGSNIPEEFHDFAVFMELSLQKETPGNAP